MKTRAERYLSSITNSIEVVLKHNVEVRIGLVPKNTDEIKSVPDSPASNHSEKLGFLRNGRHLESDNLIDSSDMERHTVDSKLSRKSVEYCEVMQQGIHEKYESSLVEHKGFQLSSSPTVLERNNGVHGTTEKCQDISAIRKHKVDIDEERLESAWLQASEKNTSALASGSKPKRSQNLRQNGVGYESQNGSSMALDISSKQWEEERSRDFKALKSNDAQVYHKKRSGVHVDPFVISPNLLHSNSLSANFDKENLEYESGSASCCNGPFCWNTRKTYRGKMKQAADVKPNKSGRLSFFGKRKLKASGSRLRR